MQKCIHCNKEIGGPPCLYCPEAGIFSDYPWEFEFEEDRIIMAEWYEEHQKDWKAGILRKDFDLAFKSFMQHIQSFIPKIWNIRYKVDSRVAYYDRYYLEVYRSGNIYSSQVTPTLVGNVFDKFNGQHNSVIGITLSTGVSKC